MTNVLRNLCFYNFSMLRRGGRMVKAIICCVVIEYLARFYGVIGQHFGL